MATFMILLQQQSGIPKYYANWDANFWVVAPTPNATYEITLAYMKQPFSITDTTQPTDSCSSYKWNIYYLINIKIYFYTHVLVEAYGYLKGPADMLQYYEGVLSKSS